MTSQARSFPARNPCSRAGPEGEPRPLCPARGRGCRAPSVPRGCNEPPRGIRDPGPGGAFPPSYPPSQAGRASSGARNFCRTGQAGLRAGERLGAAGPRAAPSLPGGLPGRRRRRARLGAGRGARGQAELHLLTLRRPRGPNPGPAGRGARPGRFPSRPPVCLTSRGHAAPRQPAREAGREEAAGGARAI